MLTLHTTQTIFALPAKRSDAVCITTNGIVKKDGKAVMGAGIAKEANNLYFLDEELALHLTNTGNVPHIFTRKGRHGCYLISFPTKHDWRNDSDLTLIARSAELLKELADRRHISACYLTPPGCGCGKLDWETQVKPVLEPILDDRFTIVFRP